MGASGVSDEYTPPRLSRLLHALPHVNVTLHRVNDTFAPNSPVYLEVCHQHARLPRKYVSDLPVSVRYL